MTGIIECTLYDFLKKIDEHVFEKVPNLEMDVIYCIKKMDLPNKLTNFSDICRKYYLLGQDKKIYEDIQDIANIRNRIHIQNQKKLKPLDENKRWTKDQIQRCGKLLRDIFILMCLSYLREKRVIPPLSDFPIPWDLL